MSGVPLGKVLLRNVIRHTGAHNKIQEESEMWKIREMEKQSQDMHWGQKNRRFPISSSSRMRSDGFDEEALQGSWKARSLGSVSVEMEDDLQHARYWNKKLYEYESNMPDRWGHSGYKELYPEEFDSDSDEARVDPYSVNGKRKSQLDKPSSLELPKRKKARKSHKKKQKKSHKKRKKNKREQPSAMTDSSQEESESDGNTGKRKRKHRRKARRASGQDSDSGKANSCASSTSGDSKPEREPEKRPKKKRRKGHSSTSERGGERVQEKRSKRKNWKVAADGNSEDSSDED